MLLYCTKVFFKYILSVKTCKNFTSLRNYFFAGYKSNLTTTVVITLSKPNGLVNKFKKYMFKM